MNKVASTNLYDYWRISVNPKFKRLRYGFHCVSGKESIYYTERGFFKNPPSDTGYYFCFPYLHPSDIFTPPEWVKDTVWRSEERRVGKECRVGWCESHFSKKIMQRLIE